MTVTERFKILSRETAIIAELLTSGLESMRKIHLNQAHYYQSFYAASMGLERLMKLILHVEQSNLDPFKLGHKLENLANALQIGVAGDSIEQKMFAFLSSFARGDRYTIIDFLHDNDSSRLAKEPVVSFYLDIILPILELHPPKPISKSTEVDDHFFALKIREDLQEITSLSEAISHFQGIDHASRFAAMYLARLARPFKDRLFSLDGNPNPYFSEHFRYLPDDDKYYLSRKTYHL
ncbi:MAG: hypothetical protein EOO88_48050 [Pedobacter sp.]|nr:MAG: hypothetical protein EOO88_48050 [Pedobacter sp.]